MKQDGRATIIGALILVAAVVWGLGIRAALQSRAVVDQGPVVNVTNTSAQVAAVNTVHPTPTRAKATATPTSTPSSTATLTRSPTSTPSPTGTSTSTATPRPTATSSPGATAARYDTPTPLLTPFGTPIIPEVGRFLLVNQDEQQLHVYENGAEIRTIPVSTGKPVANGFTPAWRGEVGDYWGAGPFLNTNLWSDYMWYLFPGTRGSILIHSVPYIRAGEIKLYDQPDALGVEPVSHGCVRISPEDAQWLKNWGAVDVPIEISPWTGEIGPPDESLWDPYLQD